MNGKSGSAACAYHTKAGEGECVTVGGDVGRVLADGETTGGTCSIMEVSTAVGQGPPLHVHEREDEYFFVLAGRARFEVDGVSMRASAGDFLCAPRGTRHAFVNVGTEALRMLVVVTPSGLEVPFREVSSRSVKETMTPAVMASIFGPYGVRILGGPLSAG